MGRLVAWIVARCFAVHFASSGPLRSETVILKACYARPQARHSHTVSPSLSLSLSLRRASLSPTGSLSLFH